MNCRMCGRTSLYRFLDLGFTPPADQFRRKDQLGEPDVYYPLQVVLCEGCGLAQLNHTVSPEVLYRNDYPYESSTTRTGRRHWSAFAASVVKRFQLPKDALAVDIGSNVGVLLGAFRDNGLRVQGVDPAANIAMIARGNGIDTICEFFNSDTAQKIAGDKGSAAVITATNVFAHVHDLDALMASVKQLLSDRGVFIFEAPYFVNLLRHLEYDTIYHEHLSYLSVKPLVPFFARHGLELFDIEQNDIHGGSFRGFVARKGTWPVTPEIARLIALEESEGVYDRARLDRFAQAVRRNKQDLVGLLQSLKQQGKRIAGVSAPAKGMTLLNYCRIDGDTLDFVTEKSQLKIGRYTPGAHIPVVADAALLETQPDYALLLAWNFAEEIMENLSEYRRRGGKFILPIPAPRIA